MLHDVLTSTRVVRPRAAAAQRRGDARRATAPAITGGEARVGPYVVIGRVREGSALLCAWDPALRREVWIVPRLSGAPEVLPARRSLSRLTRLRWVGGRRSGDDAWDAYEAPMGEALSTRLTRPVTWPEQQQWLLDVCGELVASTDDHVMLSGLSADTLWVTPTDRIVVVESDAAPGDARTTDGAPERGGMAVVADLVVRIAAANRGDPPPPRHATETLAAAKTTPTATEMVRLLQATLGRPVTVTRAKRAGLIAATVAPALALSVLGWFSTTQAVRLDAAGFKMEALASFVADSAVAIPDSVAKRQAAAAANPSGGSKIRLALQSMGIPLATTRDTVTPRDTLRHQRRLAEAYLASVLADRMRDTMLMSMFGNTLKEKRHRATILARNPDVDPATVRAARHLVDTVWKGAVPGNGSGTMLTIIPIVIAVVLLLLEAVASWAVCVLARRGPLMRGFQLEVVTADGTPAGRWRLLARSVLTWSILAAPLPAVFLAPYLPVSGVRSAIIASAVLSAVAWVLAIASALRTPQRGLVERVSATFLVPE